MRKFFAVFMILASMLFADYKVEVVGNIALLKQIDGVIYAGTDEGKLFSYSHGDENATMILEAPKVQSYVDGEIPSKIVDFDTIDGKDFVLLLYGDYMSKKLATYKNGELIKFDMPITGIKRIFLIDKDTMLLLGLGSEIIYFDLNEKKITFEHKISDSPFGGITFDIEKNILMLSNEGGEIFFFDTNAKKFLRKKEIQKDNIFSVAFNGNRAIAGSNDKSCYYENGAFSKFFNAGFLVYSVALNDKFGAFTDENGINIINTDGDIIKKIAYNGEIINNMTFYDDYLVGAGYDKTIHFWRYK